ncbi:MAG: HAD-IA family hydrolase [Nitriliruptoraceae bacterium]
MIRAIAFDVMDTLLYDPYREALQAALGERPLTELRARRDPELYPAFERGEVTEEEYWAGHRAVGLELDPVAFHRVRRAGLRWLPGMRELLVGLAGQVHRVGASNYPVWIEELETGLLAGHLDQVLASHHLGVRKPDPAFYARLLDRLALPAGEVAFVDDREENVAAARAAGLVALRFEGAVGVRAWLSELKVGARR